MQRYRIAFFIVLAVAGLLAGTVGYLWFHPRASMPKNFGWSAVTGSSSQPAAALTATQPAPAGGAEPNLVPVTLTPERIQSIGVKTGTVEYKQVRDEIPTSGNVEVDETRLAEVQVRYSGWIQKVYADATFEQVRKGQPLLTIYSPELVTTENEYLLAKQNRDNLAQSTVPGVAFGASSLLSSAVERLKQWQIPEREIEELEQTGKVKRELEVDAPASGFITDRNAFPNMYVQPGAKLYSLADLSTVWVYAQVFQNDLGRVKVGSPAEITVDTYPGRAFHGRVSFIWPQLDPATRTAKVRLETQNPDLTLSIGMFVNIRLAVPLGRQLVIPASGVFQTGTRQIAFIDMGEGHFEPRDIQVGARAGDDMVVLKGLKAGERIVTSANFLIDSESQLQAAMGSFAPPPPGVSATAPTVQQGQVSLEYASTPATPQKGNNTFRVKLTGSDGKPITNAQVTVTFFMPAMPAMGMAAMRTVTTLSDKGAGMYEGAGQVQTGGTWQVTVLATKNGQTIAQKQMSVTAEGGMQ
ncbi:MAG TPA: efflux RND transporter periplasmic adaptor subunit [Terriglobales bacterium]|nr:efflux RND transporter periplasmic adaptor subunit [Terriglobales bacterium]